MDQRFGSFALQLCGHAARLLGWRPADFWSATPAELAACLAPPADATAEPLTRSQFDHLMEQDL